MWFLNFESGWGKKIDIMNGSLNIFDAFLVMLSKIILGKVHVLYGMTFFNTKSDKNLMWLHHHHAYRFDCILYIVIAYLICH